MNIEAGEQSAPGDDRRVARAKFRVLHATTVHTCDDTRIFHKEVRSLRKAGFPTRIVGRRPKQIPPDIEPAEFYSDSSSRLKRVFANFANMTKVIRDAKPDLLHFHDPEILALLPFVRKYCGKIVYDSHEFFSKQIYHKSYIPSALQRPVSLTLGGLERLLVNYVDAVVTADYAVLDYFRGLGLNAILAQNFPDFASFSQPVDSGNRRDQGCQTGGLSRSRSAFELIEAARIGGFHLVLAGNSDAEVGEFLNGKNLPTNVQYVGMVSRGEAIKLQMASKVGFSLLTPTPHYKQAIATKIFEYIASHTIPIVDDMPFSQNLCAPFKCVRHCNVGDPQQIAQLANEAIRNYDKMKDELAADFDYAMAHFSWESQADNLVALYDSLLGLS